MDGDGNIFGRKSNEEESAIHKGIRTDPSESSSSSDTTSPVGDIPTRAVEDKLGNRETAWLSLEFSILWVSI